MVSIPEFKGYVQSEVPEVKAIESQTQLPGARELYPGFPVAYGNGPAAGFISSIQKVPAKYYLEIRKGSKIDAVVSFPYDPQALTYSRPEPVSITHTIGGTIRETNTIRTHGITASGRSGIAHRIGYNRRGQIIYVPGQVIFNEFDEFLKRYRELSTMVYGVPSRLVKGKGGGVGVNSFNLGSSGEAYSMILRCLDEDLHLLVEPTNFGWDKGIDSARFDCFWNIGFQAYGYPKYGPYRNPFLQAFDRYDQILGLVGGFVGMVTNMVNNISNDYVGRVRKSLQNTAGTMQVAIELADSFDGITANAMGVVADLYRIGTQAKRVGARYTQLGAGIDAGTSEIAQERNEFQNFGRDREARNQNTQTQTQEQVALQAQSQALLSSPPTERGNDLRNFEFGQYISAITEMTNSLEIMRGNINKDIFENSQKQNARTAADIKGVFLANEKNYGKLAHRSSSLKMTADSNEKEHCISYVMKKHEDLKSIAQKFLGDATNWTILSDLNKWRDARRDSAGDYPRDGKVILIPKDQIPGRNTFTERGDVIGVDLFMDFNDLAFDSNGDFKVVNGVENIKQSIKNVLLAKPGELAGFEDYGFPQMLDLEDTTYASAILRDTITSDPRIVDATDIVVERDEENDTQINISAKVVSVELENFNVRAPLI